MGNAGGRQTPHERLQQALAEPDLVDQAVESFALAMVLCSQVQVLRDRGRHMVMLRKKEGFLCQDRQLESAFAGMSQRAGIVRRQAKAPGKFLVFEHSPDTAPARTRFSSAFDHGPADPRRVQVQSQNTPMDSGCEMNGRFPPADRNLLFVNGRGERKVPKGLTPCLQFGQPAPILASRLFLESLTR